MLDNLLSIAFCLYLLSIPLFALAWRKAALVLTGGGALFHILFMVHRIYVSGHFPTSNMFEFLCFFAFAIVLSFLIIYALYRTVILGVFVMSITVILLAYAAAFPTGIQPLIPALQSNWLFVHVTTVALGVGAFAVSFAVALLYLILYVNKNEKPGKQVYWLELIFWVTQCFAGYSILFAVFNYLGHEHGVPFALSDKPKLDSVIWACISGLILYALHWIIWRQTCYRFLFRFVRKMDLDLLDEICYRAIAIGYPVFTLGGLVFAMIWAEQAWGRFWGWDPKETWALITWLFYSLYLHLRLSRGWIGYKSSWLAIIGFIIVMINTLGVNLIIAGLHSYA